MFYSQITCNQYHYSFFLISDRKNKIFNWWDFVLQIQNCLPGEWKCKPAQSHRQPSRVAFQGNKSALHVVLTMQDSVILTIEDDVVLKFKIMSYWEWRCCPHNSSVVLTIQDYIVLTMKVLSRSYNSGVVTLSSPFKIMLSS